MSQPSKSQSRQLLLMIIPVVIYTIAEQFGGLTWALILSVLYAVVEISWEFFKNKKVESISWISNGLVIGLSLVSFYSQDGLWFKLQPAIIEVFMTGLFWSTQFMGKPFLIEITRVQNPQILEQPHILTFLRGLNFRLGVFFLIQSGLAIYAALYFSTAYWAFLKSVGVLIMMFLYLIAEVVFYRRKLTKNNSLTKD